MNIKYKTSSLVAYYGNNRRSWEEFYPSEQYIFDKVMEECALKQVDILDAGCACGGLGEALETRYKNIAYYCGVDINEEAILYAQANSTLKIPHDFICGDIARFDQERLYDIVISLSCVDWNVETDRMLNLCWNKVKPGGYMIISLRLTNGRTINNISEGYQYIVFEEGKDKATEIANYVVYNWKEIIEKFCVFDHQTDLIKAFGYWGKPSDTAVIEYNRLCFTVFALHKNTEKIAGGGKFWTSKGRLICSYEMLAV